MANGSSAWELLYSAITDGDMERVSDLLDEGADLNERDANGATPLLAAMLDLCVGWEDESRNPRRCEIVRALVEQGGDLNIFDADGRGIFTVPIFQLDTGMLHPKSATGFFRREKTSLNE